jgi:Antitoxin VbhA
MMGVRSNDRLFILPEGIRLMSQTPKDTRTPAEKARDTAGIIGSLMHEGYVPNPEDEAIHQMAERGEITTEQLIAIFRERGLERERKALACKRQQPG